MDLRIKVYFIGCNGGQNTVHFRLENFSTKLTKHECISFVGQLGLDKSGQIVEGGTLAQAEQVKTKFQFLE